MDQDLQTFHAFSSLWLPCSSKASPWRLSIWIQSKTHMLFSQLPSMTCSLLQLIPFACWWRWSDWSFNLWPGWETLHRFLCIWSLLLLLWLLHYYWPGATTLTICLITIWTEDLKRPQRVQHCNGLLLSSSEDWVTSCSNPIHHQNIGGRSISESLIKTPPTGPGELFGARIPIWIVDIDYLCILCICWMLKVIMPSLGHSLSVVLATRLGSAVWTRQALDSCGVWTINTRATYGWMAVTNQRPKEEEERRVQMGRGGGEGEEQSTCLSPLRTGLN